MTALQMLQAIGFVRVGRWYLEGERLNFHLDSHDQRAQVLYAFVAGETVLYVGKTIKALSYRLGQHRKPGPTQFTNQKTNRNLTTTLQRGTTIDIWVLADDHPVNYGVFRLNLAAGLEDSIIEVLRPAWNGSNQHVLVEE